VKLAEQGTPGEAYNISSGNEVTMQDLLDMAISLSTADIHIEIDKSRYRPYDEKVLQSDTTRLRELTGWEPSTDLRRSLKDILEYWRTEVSLRYPPGS